MYKAKYLRPRPSSKGLVCSIPLTGGFMSGAVLWDETGGGFDGTATNSPTLQYPGMDFVAASSQYIDIGTGPTSVKSISFWVNQDDVAGTERLIDLNGTDYILTVSGVVAVFGFTTAVLYVDGAVGASGTTTITTAWHQILVTASAAKNASNFDIGRKGADYMDGIMSDVRLYSHTLTAVEAFNLYSLQKWRYGT